MLFFCVALHLWAGSKDYKLVSTALKEDRNYTVFGPQGSSRIIYSLDGGSLRNGLFPATTVTLAAWFRGQEQPMIVAVYSNANRDRDFRPSIVQPKYWRPDISGHSKRFDRFLLEELMTKLEKRYDKSLHDIFSDIHCQAFMFWN
jgi:predicted alpha/beta superfamily hydrolase